MSEQSVTIVDMDVSLEDAPNQAARIIGWLQSEGIIGQGIRAGELYRQWLDSIGGKLVPNLINDARTVYPPGPAVRRAASNDLSTLFKNWLEVDVERQVFTSGDHGIGIFCEVCHADQTKLGHEWGDAISDWHGGGDGAITCVACGYKSPLRFWTFNPVWAFGNLGFRFFDWELEQDFIAEVQEKLGHETRVVYTHL